MPAMGERRTRRDGKAYAEWNGQAWVEYPISGKPAPMALPATLQKQEDADIEMLSAASQSNSILRPTRQQLESRKLDLGPIRNRVYEARNWIGASSPESRDYASFRANLEKMRNDSLRLNKGVQTEGDAQRAWNELFNNLNDERLVSQRLGEIEQINQNAIRLRSGMINQRRQDRGIAPLDTNKFAVPSQPSASTAPQAAKPADPRRMSNDALKKALGL